MKLHTETIELRTEGFTQIQDITRQVQDVIDRSEMTEGQMLVSAIGSTTGITTLEYEPGLVRHDIANMLDKLAPYGHTYFHNQTWGDDNGAAHLRSALIGTSQSLPFQNARLILGTWQQIVFMDFDTRPRHRRIVVQVMGI